MIAPHLIGVISAPTARFSHAQHALSGRAKCGTGFSMLRGESLNSLAGMRRGRGGVAPLTTAALSKTPWRDHDGELTRLPIVDQLANQRRTRSH